MRKKGKSLSFEFFPPKEDIGEIHLFDTIRSLERFKPDFVSVTYGAGGSTLKNTRHICERMIEETSLNPMPHLTCINQGREELERLLDGYRAIGIDNILALRGDPPLDECGMPIALNKRYYARDLVAWIARESGFSIGVGVYPEGHTDSRDLEHDILYTKEKIDAGAEFGITQMFFNNRLFYDFMDRAIRVGIDIPIITSIMPITDIDRILQFCRRCGASMPEACIKRFGNGQLSKEESLKIGIEIACEQCDDLLQNGVSYFHFYTLNKDEAVAGIINNIGLRRLGLE